MENSAVNYVDLGKKIKQLRKDQKMTQAQLAEKANVSAPFLGLIERGERKASLETIVSIANALEVGLNYLLSASLNNVTSDLKTDMTLSQRSQMRQMLTDMVQELDGWNSEK